MINDENIILPYNEIKNAFDLASKTFVYDEIIQKLKSNDNKDKAIYILNLKELKNINHTNLFLNHLIEHPNDIREACAFKLNEFLNENIRNITTFDLLVNNTNAIGIIAQSICDINPSICRLVISTINKYNFQKQLQEKIIAKSIDILYNENINMIKKGYKINKQMFALYWNLEALSHLKLELNDDLKTLLIKCANMNEFYTIREKVSKIIYKNSKFQHDNEVFEISNKLKSDVCFYVSRFF